ncbi:MAG: ornithine aminotransferase [Trizodia sp. TS-e1964]|nr:MAG: ornithine aminotransferase [Trizodia sp. TS-e1964]
MAAALKATATSFLPRAGSSSSSSPDLSSAQYHSTSTQLAIADEAKYAAHNYHPLPMVFAKALGTVVTDPEGKEYLDFLSAYSAVNQGHCHPKLVEAMKSQIERCTLSSRAFHNDVFPRFAQCVTEMFGYDMVLPMNTGAEAVETALKIARKWGYKVKKIPENKAIVMSVVDNFHGRTFSAISMSTDPESRTNYGPYLPNVGAVCPGSTPSTPRRIAFNSIPDLAAALAVHGAHTAAFLVEPIQGEAGIIVPSPTYLQEVAALCAQHRVLLICDEIQTGIGRTGRLLAADWSGVKPDLVLLGKAISGGMYPVSAVLGSREVMLTVEPGTHGSTYGGNPLGCAVAIRALEVVKEEGMVEAAERKGEVFRRGLEALGSPAIRTVRGKGLLNAIVIDESKTGGRSAWDICVAFKERGLLAKPTHENIIRLAPPLVITDEQIEHALAIIKGVLAERPNQV